MEEAHKYKDSKRTIEIDGLEDGDRWNESNVPEVHEDVDRDDYKNRKDDECSDSSSCALIRTSEGVTILQSKGFLSCSKKRAKHCK